MTDTGVDTALRAAVREVVLELAPTGDPAATPESRLIEDLGFHSLALLELAFSLEDEFDLAPIDENTARAITTLGAVQDHVVGELRERGDLPTG
jgi:acyl carrier protein